MQFEWDEAKSERNRVVRGLAFRVAVTMFEGYVVEREDVRHNYGEQRICAVGQVGETILVCVYTDRDGARRIISLRRANRKERDGYREDQRRRH